MQFYNSHGLPKSGSTLLQQILKNKQIQILIYQKTQIILYIKI